MTTHRYGVGRHRALVAPWGVVMVPPGASAPWDELSRQCPSVLQLVTAVCGADLAAVSGFAAVLIDGLEVEVLVRGDYTVEVGDETVHGQPARPWTEWRTSLGGATTVLVSAPGAPARLELPIESGVVLADAIAMSIGERAPDQTAVAGRSLDPHIDRIAEPEVEEVATRPLRIVLGNGRTVEAEGSVVVGRAPGADQPHAVVAVDGREVSATHVVVERDRDSLLATDLSTNGTFVQDGSEEPRRLPPGVPTRVPVEAVFWLADDCSFRIDLDGPDE